LGFVNSKAARQRARSAGENLSLIPLPGVAQEIADVIGRDQTLHLIGRLPTSGTRSWRVCLYVPKRMNVDHILVRILGYRDAERMRRHFGGEILQPSNCRFLMRAARNIKIRELSDAGEPVAAIAQAYGLTENHVSHILRGNPPEDPRLASGSSNSNGSRDVGRDDGG